MEKENRASHELVHRQVLDSIMLARVRCLNMWETNSVHGSSHSFGHSFELFSECVGKLAQRQYNHLVGYGAVQRCVAHFRISVVFIHVRSQLQQRRHNASRRVGSCIDNLPLHVA